MQMFTFLLVVATSKSSFPIAPFLVGSIAGGLSEAVGSVGIATGHKTMVLLALCSTYPLTGS